MKAEVEQNKLSSALSLAEKVTGKNLSLPILNCVLLSSSRNTLRVSATNLDLGLEISLPAKVSLEGVVAVRPSTLTQVVSATYAKSISLEVKGGNLSLKTTSGTSLFKAVPHDDFPTIPSLKGVPSITLPAEDFARGAKSVWYSASAAALKPELASVCVFAEAGKLVFVATDSFRLAEKSFPLRPLPEISHLLIPHRNVAEILRFLEAESENNQVEILYTENQIAFRRNGGYLTSRLVSGTFPDYRQIIPKKPVSEAVLLKQDFASALKKTSAFSDKFSQVSISVKPSSRSFSLHAENADVGETTETLQASLSGEDVTMSFNHRYLSEALPSFASDSISLSFHGQGKPLLIKGVSDASFLYLVMPMNR